MEGRTPGNRDAAMTDDPKQNLAQVPVLATPTGEADPYGWVERSVWTERMVGCLRRGGPDGGKWFSLHDKVFATKTLEAGFSRVLANRGAPGIDGVTVDVFGERLTSEIQSLQAAWQAGTYRTGCGEAGMDPEARSLSGIGTFGWTGLGRHLLRW